MFSTSNHVKSKTVVDSARQAREERAQQRRKESAILILQSSARGFLTRNAIGRRWRNELDLLLNRTENIELKEDKLSDKGLFEESVHISPLNKISLQSDQLSQAEWQFASFGQNTLTGAYGNFSSKSNDKLPSPKSSTVEIPETDVVTEKRPEDSSFADLSISSSSSTSLSKPTKQELFQAIKQFLFVFNKKKDFHRYLDLIKFLQTNAQTELSSKYSYVYLCIHKQYAVAWISQIKQILWQTCKYLDEIQLKDNDKLQFGSVSDQAIDICLSVLMTFTDVSQWKSLQKQTALHGVLEQMCLSICTQLHDRGAMCIVANTLKNNITLFPNVTSITFSITFLFRLVSAKKASDELMLNIVLTILTIPGLILHLEEKCSQSLNYFKNSQFLLRIVSILKVEDACNKCGLASSNHQSFNQVTDVLSVLGNLLHLCIGDVDTLKRIRVEVVVVLNELLKCICENSFASKSHCSIWHPVFGYISENKIKKSQLDAMHAVKHQLEFLWCETFVREVFHDMLALPSLHDDNSTPTQAEQIASQKKAKVKLATKLSSYLRKFSRSRKIVLPTGGRKLEYSEVRNTCNSCLLYKRALSVLRKQVQLEMLTGITFNNDILGCMWRFICELGPSGGFELFLYSLSLPRDVSEPYFAVFTLFCSMTSHIISILDDVEFYEQQIPFHLEELVIISTALRQFVFKIIWSGTVKDSSSEMYYVFDSAHTLLMMLYDRDARRSFTPLNHWLCDEVKPSLIRGEVEKSIPRSKLVLQKIPFVLSHKDRVILFRNIVAADKRKLNITSDSEPQQRIRVRRSVLVEDGFAQLNNLPSHTLKGVIRVKFFNDLGLDEAGIDQDGVFKEFLEEIIKKVFNPNLNLFKVTTGVEPKLYPSPLSYIQDDHLSLFTFTGLMLGKALYEGIVIDLPFANFFLRSVLSNQYTALYSPIDELPSLDAEFYKNLTWIKRYEGDISDLGLSFTYEEDVMGEVVSHDLVPDGSSIPVTNDNRFMYVHTLAHYRMHTQIREQTKAFLAGFRSLIPQSWTAMFSAPELQRLISGDNVELDLSDLKRHVVYYGGFHSSHRVVKWLWDVLERDYNPQQRSNFLKFVTSCSRPPLLGFAHLNPQFTIRCVDVPDDEDTGDTVGTFLRGFFRVPTGGKRGHKSIYRLPTASTCFNLLKLPNYPSKDILKEKLKQAIENNTGFELS